MAFIDRLQYLIDKSNITHKEIEEKTGVKNISHYKSGRVKPSFDAIVDLSDFFQVSTDWLLKGVGPGPDETALSSIPVFGHIAVDIGILNNDIAESFVALPEGVSADFACHVIGDSMKYAGIFDGDTAFFRRTETAEAGQIIAVRKIDSDNKIDLKFYIRKNGQAYLRSANPDYEDIPLTSHHRIHGVLVALLKNQIPTLTDYENFLHHKNEVDNMWSEVATLATANGIPAKFVKQLIELQLSMSQHNKKE